VDTSYRTVALHIIIIANESAMNSESGCTVSVLKPQKDGAGFVVSGPGLIPYKSPGEWT
jgi:hypothetical protein